MGRNPPFIITMPYVTAQGIQKIEGELLRKKLLRLKGDRFIPDLRGEGDDYCWECGHIAPKGEFLKSDYCPNSECPHPEDWND